MMMKIIGVKASMKHGFCHLCRPKQAALCFQAHAQRPLASYEAQPAATLMTMMKIIGVMALIQLGCCCLGGYLLVQSRRAAHFGQPHLQTALLSQEGVVQPCPQSSLSGQVGQDGEATKERILMQRVMR